MFAPRSDHLLLKTEGTKVTFVPITKVPTAGNFYLLEVTKKLRLDEGTNSFVPYSFTGILFMKHGEVQQKLVGFTSRTYENLIKRIKAYVKRYM